MGRPNTASLATQHTLPSQAALLWLVLGVALSPSLAELVRHWTREPWARESATFVPLALGAAWVDRCRARPHREAWLVVLAAVFLSGLGFAAGLDRLGRLAIPVAVLGMARVLGHPSLAIAAIAALVIPPPFGLMTTFSPALEEGVARGLTEIARVAGAGWTVVGSTVHTSGGSLRLAAPDMGLPLAHLLGGLGLCAAIAARDALPRALLRAAHWTLWAVPAQGLALCGGLACLALAGDAAARAFLDVVPTCAVASAGVTRLRAVRPR